MNVNRKLGTKNFLMNAGPYWPAGAWAVFLGVWRRIPSSAREGAIFSSGKDGEAGDVGFIVDARVQPGGKMAARSQIEFSDRLLGFRIVDD
jgi:hypothetical protein